MTESSSSSSDGLGNSRTKPQISPAVKWCFTHNNYDNKTIEFYSSMIKEKCKVGFFSKEVGEEGTPHLQGYIEFKKKSRPCSANLFASHGHWEKSKGTLKENFDYCMNSEDKGRGQERAFTFGRVPKELKCLKMNEFLNWQKQALTLYNENINDDRHIIWIFGDPEIGKSAFVRYMLIKHEIILASSGKYRDIINLVFNQDLELDRDIIFDIPLEAQGKVSFQALEKIKDGMIVNTKYEGGFKVFNPPRIMVFANSEPEYEGKIARDRFRCYRITGKDGELVEHELPIINDDSDTE